jgi:DNA-binding NarL/FixJ family response regulator
VRLLIAEDTALLREGLIRLVTEAGHDVIATAGDAFALEEIIREGPVPDVALLDIRMPPTQIDEGSQAALRLRETHPQVGILMLSQHIEARHALRMMSNHPRGFGYLLKDRVLDIDELLEALERVAAGGFAVDPEVITQLMGRAQTRDALNRLTAREHDVIDLVAQGYSNAAISRRLRLSAKTVENHVSNLFAKLDLGGNPDEHRRVRAVLIHLAR